MAFRSISCSERIESGLWTDTGIERLMSHKERNNVRAAYIHKAEFIEERRLIMNWWSRTLRLISRSMSAHANLSIRKSMWLTFGASRLAQCPAAATRVHSPAKASFQCI